MSSLRAKTGRAQQKRQAKAIWTDFMVAFERLVAAIFTFRHRGSINSSVKKLRDPRCQSTPQFCSVTSPLDRLLALVPSLQELQAVVARVERLLVAPNEQSKMG